MGHITSISDSTTGTSSSQQRIHYEVKAILERILLNYGKKITTELVVVKNLKKTGFPGGSDGKTSVYNTGDLGSIPGSGRSAGGRTDPSILGWRIPWTEKPGGLQSMRSERARHD